MNTGLRTAQLFALAALVGNMVARAAQEHVQPPPAMLAFEQARRSIVSGRIEWTAHVRGPHQDAFAFVSRYARNGDMILEQRGDSRGWTVTDRSGVGQSRAPQLRMVNEDGHWHYQETSTNCVWWERDNEDAWQSDAPYHELFDVRAVGVSPFSGSIEFKRGLSSLWPPAEDPVVEWGQEQSGDLFVVKARQRSGVIQTWYINAAKGWNAERITVEHEGIPYREVRCVLRQYEDVWLPEETQYYNAGQLEETVNITKAQVNQTSDAPRFTLNELGVEPGSAIAKQNRPRAAGTPRERAMNTPTWSGKGIVTEAEWRRGVELGLWDWGPNYKRTIGASKEKNPYVAPEQVERRRLFMRDMKSKQVLYGQVGLWDEYVREFIKRYALEEQQCEKAGAILRDCQKRAQEIIDRRRNELSETVSKLLDADEAGKAEEVAKLRERLQIALRPVEAIFEESLKPRLDKLPTRAQRAAAEAKPSGSQPAAEKKP